MDNENLDNVEKEINNKNAVEERFINLNKRAKEAEDKALAETKARTETEAKLAQMEKESKFLNSFSDVTAKFPTASEYKDKIKEKVMSGYSVDDATISILHAEGKLSSTPSLGNIAGGSAPNQITNQTQKTVKEMNSNERWAALAEAERRGDLGMN